MNSQYWIICVVVIGDKNTIIFFMFKLFRIFFVFLRI